MPRPAKPKPIPKHQQGRHKLRMGVTLSPEARADLAEIRERVPGVNSTSAAIQYAAAITLHCLRGQSPD